MNKKNNWFQRVFLEGRRPYFWIVLIGFLVYLPTLFFGFTYLDDNELILNNFHFVKELSNIFNTFKEDVFLSYADAYYRPIFTISLILDAQWAGTSPFIYHLTNIILHVLASCLVFVVLLKLKYKKQLALFFGLIFVVHPVLTQAVAWIPGRNDSLMTLFLLAAFIFFLKFLDDAIPPPHKNWKNYLWHILFFTLAFFTKEISLFLVFLCLAYLQLIKKEKIFSQDKLKLGMGWAGVIAFWFLMRSWAFVNPLAMPFSVMVKSVWQNLPAALQMFGKVVLPFNLSVLPIIEDTTFIYGMVSLALLLLLLVFSKQKRLNYILFGAFWFLVFLLPSFIRPNIELVADFIEHRLYLPILGFFIIASEIDWLKNLDATRPPPKNRKVLIISGLVLVLLAGLTINHCFNFKGRLSFWKNAAENSPHSPLAHRNLGAMYYLDSRLDQAEIEYKKSLELNSQEEMVHNNLGLIYMNKNMFEEAEIEYKKELEINPFYDDAYFNLGLLYYKKGEFEKAKNSWEETLQINPEHIKACYNLAAYYIEQDNLDRAAYYINYLKKRGVDIDIK